MTIVGTVGGASAAPANQAFSEGFAWGNFDLLPSGDGGTNRRAEDGISDPYSCNTSTPGSVIVAFLRRLSICCGLIFLIFLTRAFLRRLLMFW